VIVGGMTLGTLMTLFVLPTVYTLLSARVWKRHHDEDHAPVLHPPAAPGAKPHPAE